MKKISVIFFLCLFGLTNLYSANFFNKKRTLSPISPAKIIYLEPLGDKCNIFCLNEFIRSGAYLSFLANYSLDNSDEKLDNIYAKLYNSITNFLFNPQKINDVKIALIIPQNIIKSQSISTINSSLAYLIKKKDNISFKVYLTGDDSPANLQKAINEIKKKNYFLIISPNTYKGALYLTQNLENQIIFFPNLTKDLSEITTQNARFGGIDYDAQIDALLNLASKKIAIITDKDKLFSTLNEKIEQKLNSNVYKITKQTPQNAKIFKKNPKLENASVFLNLKILDIIHYASTMRASKTQFKNLLTTQIAFHPALLRIGQNEDLKHLFIANSLGKVDDELDYINEFLGVDIKYDRLAYAINAGLDSIYSDYFNDTNRYFTNEFYNGALKYEINIYKATNKSFHRL